MADIDVRPHRFVACHADLLEVIERLECQPSYALDTEFHRERTYWPKVALVQIAWPGNLVLIDPLEVDLSPLCQLMNSPSVATVHAALQDLEVLELTCGAVPRRLFDTQIAAGFVGMSSPSLAALHERELGVRLPKTNRMTDWLERPLRGAQLDYAAADVERLLEIREHLESQLAELGRLDWAQEEFQILLSRDRGPRDPNEAWRKIKETRHLSTSALRVARSVAAWRERRAAEVDQPVRWVLSDIAVVAIAQSLPRNPEALSKVRGVDRGLARGTTGAQIIEAVEYGLVDEWWPPPPVENRKNGQNLRSAVALVSAWIHQLARDQALDPALLATRADVEALVRGDMESRLARGWRADMVGDPIRRLVDGEGSLAFDGSRVVLEQRSHRSIN